LERRTSMSPIVADMPGMYMADAATTMTAGIISAHREGNTWVCTIVGTVVNSIAVAAVLPV